MKKFNKIIFIYSSAVLGLLALAGCEGGELYDVNAPDWISDKIQEIEDANKSDEEVLEGMQEDVYTIGSTDFSTGWWTAFSKDYVVPDGQKWNAVFNLHINPDDNTYYKNFALVLSNDMERGSNGYKEYGAIRFDVTNDTTAFNSQWGSDFYYLPFKYTTGSLILSPTDNLDANVQSLGGKVTLTVDRTQADTFAIKMTNGVATKTYKQPYKLPSLNEDASNTNIRCFLVPEGSYIEFQQTNIVPIGGLTSAADKNPVSMELQNVPTEVGVGTPLEEAMADVTAKVTFEEGVTKDVTASELQFSAIPDIDQPGEKTLVAIYNKTFKGENCESPIMANATFNAVAKIVSIAVTTLPTRQTYNTYSSLTGYTLAFDPTGIKVTATDAIGEQRIVDNATLTFSTIPATEGTHDVTISTEEGIKTTISVRVSKKAVSEVSNNNNIVGNPNNSTAFLGAFSDNFKVSSGETKSISFINYSNLEENWNNFLIVLRNSQNEEYTTLRADNWALKNGAEATWITRNGTQSDWANWLKGMNGAKVTVFVTNNGNGTAEVLAVMDGTTNQKSTQYYYGINNIDSNDLYFALSVDHCHLVFNQ